jgi:hypothetical protein
MKLYTLCTTRSAFELLYYRLSCSYRSRLHVFPPRVGYGDICPGEEMTHVGKLFLVVFVFSGLGMFCGPIASLASTWRLHIPGGLMTLASVTIGVGVMIFTTFEEIDQVEAIYASVITGMCACVLRQQLAVCRKQMQEYALESIHLYTQTLLSSSNYILMMSTYTRRR